MNIIKSEFVQSWKTKFHWNTVSHEFSGKMKSTIFVEYGLHLHKSGIIFHCTVNELTEITFSTNSVEFKFSTEFMGNNIPVESSLPLIDALQKMIKNCPCWDSNLLLWVILCIKKFEFFPLCIGFHTVRLFKSKFEKNRKSLASKHTDDYFFCGSEHQVHQSCMLK